MSVVNFQLSRDDVTEELLDRFMMKEKQRLNDEKDSLRQASGVPNKNLPIVYMYLSVILCLIAVLAQERIENLTKMDELQHDMSRLLSSDVRLLHDLPTTKKIADLTKHFDETAER